MSSPESYAREMREILSLVARARRRLWAHDALGVSVHGLWIAAGGSALAVIVAMASDRWTSVIAGEHGPVLISLMVAAPLLIAGARAVARRPSAIAAARLADRTLRASDLLTTAWEIARNAGQPEGAARIVVHRAAHQGQGWHRAMTRAWSPRPGRLLTPLLALTAAAIWLALVEPPPEDRVSGRPEAGRTEQTVGGPAAAGTPDNPLASAVAKLESGTAAPAPAPNPADPAGPDRAGQSPAGAAMRATDDHGAGTPAGEGPVSVSVASHPGEALAHASDPSAGSLDAAAPGSDGSGIGTQKAPARARLSEPPADQPLTLAGSRYARGLPTQANPFGRALELADDDGSRTLAGGPDGSLPATIPEPPTTPWVGVRPAAERVLLDRYWGELNAGETR